MFSKWGAGINPVASQQEGPVLLQTRAFLCPWFPPGAPP